MQHVTLWNALSAPYSILFHIAMFFVMNEYRYPRKKAAAYTVIFNLPILAITIVMYMLLGSERGGQLALLFYLVPQLAVNFFLSRYRDGRLFSAYFLVNGIFIFIIQITNLMDYYSPYDNHIVMFLSRLISYPAALAFLYKVLSKPYRRAMRELREGWGLFAYISAMFTLLLIVEFNFPGTLSERPYDIPAFIMTFIVMVLSNIYYFRMQLKLRDHYRQQELSRYQEQQMEMMQQRIEYMAEAEKTVSIYRHDIRHILMTLSGMVSEGLYDEAIAYIKKHIGTIEEVTYTKWCEEPVLNAMFSAYFVGAIEQGIKVDARIDIKKLPNDKAAMLSVLCANVIENAIHAVRELPDEKKTIRVRAVQFPKLMFSVSNPYEGSIQVDDNGIPVTNEEGHGIGIRSILDYCEKNDADYDFKIQNGCFSVRIVER
ncbi:MAG: GHKL domain-containing protein [Lachnospiraceae bacterium]|nr:GHKL domain-containing protein [Lachnospiraceae bacterium]